MIADEFRESREEMRSRDGAWIKSGQADAGAGLLGRGALSTMKFAAITWVMTEEAHWDREDG